MAANQTQFEARVAALDSVDFLTTLKNIRRGVEREALRIQSDGTLAQTPHPVSLGSALTHESITTDFSESLLEFITPPEADSKVTMEQLADVHKYVLANLDGERLWPMSMPCFIEDESSIPIAHYGSSNVGKMKKVYRVGLKNRYGSMMQAISGVHFNFSFPDEFWQQWAKMEGIEYSQDTVSAAYFSLIRNYRRFCWLIPFLYGASPALCGSFLKGKEHKLPFERVGKGTYYLPYATSLRMSDLGYTNAEQSALKICYNKLDNYIALLREAMYSPSTSYTQYAAGEGGHYQQLSKNVLQIENELYSPIRPKQPTASMEKPTDALARRGVSYIEVRALDVNPFSALGIDREQFDFLDIFLLTCLLTPSEELTEVTFKESDDNLSRIVLEGRKPGLMLQKNGEAVPMQQWAETLFANFKRAAVLLDKANDTRRYTQACEREWQKVLHPDTTPSGKWLGQLLENDWDNGDLGLKLADEYTQTLASYEYVHTNESSFAGQAKTSLAKQSEIEAEDDKDFDTFIREYFEAPQA